LHENVVGKIKRRNSTAHISVNETITLKFILKNRRDIVWTS